jgi:hypothetical protein
VQRIHVPDDALAAGPGTTPGVDQTGPGIQDATAPMNDMCAHQPRS